jgi:hypothetical protein
MIKKLKKIKPGRLITHVIVTLAYPAIKAFTAAGNGLRIFADAMTIVGLLLLAVGVVYSMNLHGDFDISRYYLRRGVRSFRFFAPRQSEELKPEQNAAEFLQEAREKRQNAFNYPLFLGIVYLLLSLLIVYVFLH